MNKKSLPIRIALKTFSFIIGILSLPPVRNFIWNKLMKTSQDKIIEIEGEEITTYEKDIKNK
jgi:hypothetical protein